MAGQWRTRRGRLDGVRRFSTLGVFFFALVGLALSCVLAVGSVEARAALAAPQVPTPEQLVVGPKIVIPSALWLANPLGSAALVSPAQADQVAVTMWRLWEHALIARDTTALAQLTARGALLGGELYNCAWPSVGCVTETSPRPIDSITPIVPVQQRYPLYFLAEVDTIQNIGGLTPASARWVPWVELQVLTKASATAPWQMSFDTGYDGQGDLEPPQMPFGLQVVGGQPGEYNPTPLKTASASAATFLPSLAQYYQSFKDTGGPPTPDGFFTGGAAYKYGSQLGMTRQGSDYEGSRNLYDFTADPSAGEWEFSDSNGLPIECGTVLDTSTNSPTGGLGILGQNPDRTNWGMALPPGTYSAITTKTTHTTCVYETGEGLDAAGNGGYMIDVTGVRSGPVLTLFASPLIWTLVVAVVIGLVASGAVSIVRRHRVTGFGIPAGTGWYPPPGGPPYGVPGGYPPPSGWPRPPPPPPGWPPSPGSQSHAWSPPQSSTEMLADPDPAPETARREDSGNESEPDPTGP